MTATLKVTHKAIGAEVRRHTYDVILDGECVGAVDMNASTEIAISPGPHSVQIRDGRKSSSTHTFDVPDAGTVSFRCTGKRFLPLFLASFVIPSLAIKLVPE